MNASAPIKALDRLAPFLQVLEDPRQANVGRNTPQLEERLLHLAEPRKPYGKKKTPSTQ